MRRWVWFGLLVTLASCGQKTGQRTQAIGPCDSVGLHLLEQQDAVRQKATGPAACPLEFSESGLCAAIDWPKPPTADTTVSFRLRFWKKDQGTRERGPFVVPPQPPTSFFIMKCCKTPYALTLVPVQKKGVYQGCLNLASGEYFHHVQVGSEKKTDDRHVD